MEEGEKKEEEEEGKEGRRRQESVSSVTQYCASEMELRVLFCLPGSHWKILHSK